jgi:RNA 2',3'-cyclic 3'-phosphodiesterase
MSLRSFIAVEITDEVRSGLAAAQALLKETGAHVGYTAPENIHLTLQFLGDVLEENVPALEQGLDAAAARIAPFSFSVAGVGYFGDPRSPRVVWAGIPDAPPELAGLQDAVAALARDHGIPVEDRPFKPHLTLGRVRSRRGVAELTAALASIRNTAFGAVPVRRVLLMRSHLERPAVRYSILHAAQLKGT